MQEELIDRFGKLPESALSLLSTHRLRISAAPIGIQKIDATDQQVLIHFKDTTTVDPLKLIDLVQTRKNVRFSGPDKLRIDIKATDIKERTDAIRSLLRDLGVPAQTTVEKAL
jgi:transcription-repair coupling factor (superfamily II helicase)